MSNAGDFVGAKLALFLGPDIAVIRRDAHPGLIWAGRLDLPGGGREPGETPEACVLRELQEELSLRLLPENLCWRRYYDDPRPAWFFAAHLPAARVAEIVLGDEVQSWGLMRPEAFVDARDGIPHFQARVREYLAAAPAARFGI